MVTEAAVEAVMVTTNSAAKAGSDDDIHFLLREQSKTLVKIGRLFPIFSISKI